jgi:PTS system nitrogen regulatory IIA component
MQNILHAILHKRFFALPATDKSGALEFLAREMLSGSGLEAEGGAAGAVGEIQRREREFNTGIGHGVAVPHLRVEGSDGAIRCVAGWSAEGIDYDATDCKPVHLVVMYCIPDSQRDAYLREISGLMKMIIRHADIADALAALPDIEAARRLLLAWGGGAEGGSPPPAT